MSRNTIVVTGGTGYIASWIVKELLEAGQKVRITVRDKAKVSKYRHLLDIEKTTEGSLFVYEADLMEIGSFNEAVKGADYVIHTASPFIQDGGDDPQRTLIDPAVEGTKNVLTAVNLAGSVKRVVLTSSMAAIYGDNMDMKVNKVSTLDESMWNTTSSLFHGPYSFSKTLAEKAAWSMCDEQKVWDLVTIHPGFVLGPSLTTRVDSTSIHTMLRILRGELAIGAPDLQFVFSDVRDVAKGHLLALFTPEASGRYIVANESGNLLQLGRIIGDEYGKQYKVPKKLLPNWLVLLLSPMIGFTRKYTSNNIGYPLSADNARSINGLGMTYHSLKVTVLDHVAQLKRDDLI